MAGYIKKHFKEKNIAKSFISRTTKREQLIKLFYDQWKSGKFFVSVKSILDYLDELGVGNDRGNINAEMKSLLLSGELLKFRCYNCQGCCETCLYNLYHENIRKGAIKNDAIVFFMITKKGRLLRREIKREFRESSNYLTLLI